MPRKELNDAIKELKKVFNEWQKSQLILPSPLLLKAIKKVIRKAIKT